jgi:hypothetical protein
MNLIFLVDPYERYTREEKNIFPRIEEENKSFGTFLGYALEQERAKGSKILVWSNDVHLGVMKQIPKKIYKLFKGKFPNYDKIYICGFHYGICVEECACILHSKYEIPREKIGIVLNLSIPAPEQPIHKIENYFQSDFQLYYWTNLSFVPISITQV